MREIKFREWSTKYKEMIDWEVFKNKTDLGAVLNNEYENIIHMQYTGLKDKNGKEIYDGDIIIWSEKRYKIVWHEKIAGFVMENNGIERPDIEFDIEIIGNIYENPELIGQ